MTQSRPPEDTALDADLAAMRDAPPGVSEALMAKVMADAMSEMPKAVRAPLWRQILTTLGGWPAMAGLAATAGVGIWAGGVLSDDVLLPAAATDSAALDIGEGLGAFDLLLVEG